MANGKVWLGEKPSETEMREDLLLAATVTMETLTGFLEWVGGVGGMKNMGVLEANGKAQEEAIKEGCTYIAEAISSGLTEIAEAIRGRDGRA
jgi:hypothetical protein